MRGMPQLWFITSRLIFFPIMISSISNFAAAFRVSSELLRIPIFSFSFHHERNWNMSGSKRDRNEPCWLRYIARDVIVLPFQIDFPFLCISFLIREFSYAQRRHFCILKCPLLSYKGASLRVSRVFIRKLPILFHRNCATRFPYRQNTVLLLIDKRLRSAMKRISFFSRNLHVAVCLIASQSR